MREKSISDRENFLRAIEFNYPEWIPINWEIIPAAWDKYGKELTGMFRRHPLLSGQFIRGFGEAEPDPTFVERKYFKDDWGSVWYCAQQGVGGRVVEKPLSDWKAFDKYKAPDPLDTLNWQRIKENTEERRQNELITIAMPEVYAQVGFYDRLVFLRGYENLLIDFAEEPPQLGSLIEMVLEYNMKYIRKWLEIGVDVMWHHGDIGSQNGLVFSPEMFRKYLKPGYIEMFQACRREGVRVWYSSDGNILEIVDDLIECGASMHDPQVRPNAIDGIAKHYKGKLCAAVDIDEQMLPYCRPEDIDQQVKEIVDKIGTPEGGLMLFAAPSHDVPLENFEAIINAWEEHCFNK